MHTWTKIVFSSIVNAVVLGGGACAHETRPGYLELRQSRPHEYDALWKQPSTGEFSIHVTPIFPAGSEERASADPIHVPGAVITRFRLVVPSGLDGATIRFAGLERTLTDVLVRLVRTNQSTEAHWAHSTLPNVHLGVNVSKWGWTRDFFVLGARHIFLSCDHLVFVLGLLLIVPGRGLLLKTITAFTVAHSVTLGVATFGWANVPPQPLNAAIALSIFFLGLEVVRRRQGETSLALEQPWMIAFGFGLLHGFGFASSLTALGIPHAEIPLALLSFNAGVEAGQLTFVFGIILLIHSFQVLECRWAGWAEWAPAYIVGTLGAFWTIQRVGCILFAT